MLPAVFALAESCVEALATDSMRAEAKTDVSGAHVDTPEPVLSDRQVRQIVPLAPVMLQHPCLPGLYCP